jgi:hypothetical protein
MEAHDWQLRVGAPGRLGLGARMGARKLKVEQPTGTLAKLVLEELLLNCTVSVY